MARESDLGAEGTIPASLDDVELRAMWALQRYFLPLDRAQRHRVLDWARARFVSAPFPELPPDWMDQFTTGLTQAAATIKGVTPLDLIRFAETVAQLRDDAVAAGQIGAPTVS